MQMANDSSMPTCYLIGTMFGGLPYCNNAPFRRSTTWKSYATEDPWLRWSGIVALGAGGSSASPRRWGGSSMTPCSVEGTHGILVGIIGLEDGSIVAVKRRELNRIIFGSDLTLTQEERPSCRMSFLNWKDSRSTITPKEAIKISNK